MTRRSDLVQKANFCRRVIQVQDRYLEKKTDGNTTIYVFREYIQPEYYISLTTLYRYLGHPAKRDLKRIEAQLKEMDEAKAAEQLSLKL